MPASALSRKLPVVETARLIITELRDDDAAGILRLRSDPQVNEFVDRPIANHISDAVKFIENIRMQVDVLGALYWGIRIKANDQFAGTICLWNFHKEKNSCDIGYELLPEFWSKGLMKEAVLAVLQFAVNSLRLDEINAWVSPGNGRSVELLKKVGFRRCEVTHSDSNPEECYTMDKLDIFEKAERESG